MLHEMTINSLAPKIIVYFRNSLLLFEINLMPWVIKLNMS